MDPAFSTPSDIPQQDNETTGCKDTTANQNRNETGSQPTESTAASLHNTKRQLSHMQVLSCQLISDIHSKMSTIRRDAILNKVHLNNIYRDCLQLLEKEKEVMLAKSSRMEEKAKLELEDKCLNLVNFMECLNKIKTKDQVRKLHALLRTLSKPVVGLDEWEPPIHLRVSKEMTHIVKPVSEQIEFDPESAHPSLSLSPDLKRVRFEPCPDITEARKNCFQPGLYILGRPGFKSGRHYWEVDVGSKRSWIIGVVRETVERKGTWEINSENGYWVLRKQDDNVFYGIGDSFISLTLETLPMRIGVCLDLFKNHLAFYNADTMRSVFQLSVCAEQKLFPFFCPGVPVREEDWCPLTLC
ncbi:E3 ubiquitin-protein ligase TRIM69-like isoform X1 [Hyperolius riggenbachi]|uniref:E3 ubiquitin-protein ligase TRIM69-like isoform X1 n=1 Tax=Hyperolius riggenbachi TaxID=752182 RepID=UPI0035A31F06